MGNRPTSIVLFLVLKKMVAFTILGCAKDPLFSEKCSWRSSYTCWISVPPWFYIILLSHIERPTPRINTIFSSFSPQITERIYYLQGKTIIDIFMKMQAVFAGFSIGENYETSVFIFIFQYVKFYIPFTVSHSWIIFPSHTFFCVLQFTLLNKEVLCCKISSCCWTRSYLVAK